ncbi:hypothetical protein PRIPAC_75079 [Pristionchus pacificus]|uniref:Uncharacterized protein n=1 Tax=Pristionchus pacificus TaxID=54126 RepID=A0A2A6C6E2_PRIPA|nr:hypothetical protein PRIPAC_75079 [Pristionchus pacificus]|eukprot:PDM73648.1 hypothetical protein PRIPAC_41004 [Pristionchus pacificus]
MSSFDDQIASWYRSPLDSDDILAGASLLVLLVLFIPLYGLVIHVFVKTEREIIGFRYLLSAAVADLLCMLQYAGLNGIAILTKSRLVSRDGRHWLQMYIDYVWSRLHSILFLYSFQHQSRLFSYGACLALGWIAPLIFECAIHWQPFMTVFFFEPAMYGMLSEDFGRYLTDGQSTMILSINAICGFLPFLFYGLAVILLIKHGITSTSKLQRVEIMLILPCVVASVVFVVGQLAITFGTGSGKWFTWSICALFFVNSALQPLLLIAFSPFVRRGVIRLLLYQQQQELTSKVSTVSRTSMSERRRG